MSCFRFTWTKDSCTKKLVTVNQGLAFRSALLNPFGEFRVFWGMSHPFLQGPAVNPSLLQTPMFVWLHCASGGEPALGNNLSIIDTLDSLHQQFLFLVCFPICKKGGCSREISRAFQVKHSCLIHGNLRPQLQAVEIILAVPLKTYSLPPSICQRPPPSSAPLCLLPCTSPKGSPALSGQDMTIPLPILD